MSIVRKPDGLDEVMAGNAQADGYIQGHGDTKVVVLSKAALSADEGFVLIDLSDAVTFPHTETGKIRLYSIKLVTERQTDGAYIVYIGVITEIDATDGSTAWLLAIYLETVDNPTDSTDRRAFIFDWPNGLDLEVSAGVLVNMLSNVGHAGDATWQTDTPLDSPAGDTTQSPGAGDLVMYVDETGGAGTISLTATVEYITEAV